MNRTVIMVSLIAAGIGIILTIIYMHGEARYKAGYSKAREETATEVAGIAKKHAIELAKAIEKTRQQEIAFHDKLAKLKAVPDFNGCLDRPLPEFTDSLRDTYPGQRGSPKSTMRPGPLARWSQYPKTDR